MVGLVNLFSRSNGLGQTFQRTSEIGESFYRSSELVSLSTGIVGLVSLLGVLADMMVEDLETAAGILHD